MSYMEAAFQLSFDAGDLRGGKDKQVSEVFKGKYRQIIEVRLQGHAILARHRASEPISVLCLSGNGVFRAGPNLEDEQLLTPGTLLLLDAEIDHEVVAEVGLHLLVTKFKSS